MTTLPRKTLSVDATVSDQEVVVYTLHNHQAHCLEGKAKDLYLLCDGERSLGEAAKELGLPESEVEGLLDGLFASGLLMYPEVTSEESERLSRRKFMAGATAGAGLILSLGLPTAAAAASCIASAGCNFGNSGTPCNRGAGCTDNCMNCYSYSGLDITNTPIPAGSPCRFVINIAACLTYGAGGTDFQQDCSASFLVRGIDQAWCCVPVGGPFVESAANGGNTAPLANGGGACAFP